MSDASASGDVLPPPPDLPISPRTADILRGIADPELRRHVQCTVAYGMGALENLQGIHLPQDNFEEQLVVPPVVRDHVELIPGVIAAVGSVNHLLSYIMQTFPYQAPPDGLNPSDPHFDLTFDLVEGPGDPASHKVPSPGTAPKPLTAQVADHVHSVAAGLRGCVVSFGDRLQFALAQNESWALLAELDDYKHRIIKAVQAVIFAALEAFVPEGQREEILPAYRSSIAEAVDVRSALCDLSYHVRRFSGALVRANAQEIVALVVALADHLARFCAKPAYRNLRTEDKKAVIDFRHHLHDMRHSPAIPVRRLRHAVEGFAAFLEAMHAINLREMLVAHDRQSLELALERLDKATQSGDSTRATLELSAVVADLSVVQGRNSELDDARRQFVDVAAGEVVHDIIRWRALLQNAVTHLS